MSFKTLPSEKLYFYKYRYKITLKLNECPHNKITKKFQIMRWWTPAKNTNIDDNGNRFRTIEVNDSYTASTLKKISKINEITDGNYQIRARSSNFKLDIYINEEEHLNAILEFYKNIVEEVRKPLSNEHSIALYNERITVRKQVFWNKFRYKITLGWREFDNLSPAERRDLNEFCNNIEGNNRYNLHAFSRTIYLNEEEDVVLFKLSYSELIKELLIVKTYDEL